MMLQIQKKQKYNFFINKLILVKSLVAIFATGLFAVNNSSEVFTENISKNSIFKPIKGLNNKQYDEYILGKSFFRIPWVEAPSATTARDGLGPLYSANTCISCHPSNGRGTLFTEKKALSRALVVRLSIPNDKSKEHQMLFKKNGFIPEPVYGSQLSINGVHGVKFEGRPNIKYKKIKVNFPDKEVATLLKPIYTLKDLNYGKLHKDAIISYRMAPTLMGMGLIELISNEQILKNEDADDKNGDGISGKANWVYSSLTKKYELGRYTWKASVATVVEQIANAMHNDMGLTTPFHKVENCTKFQKACNEAPKDLKYEFDVPKFRLDSIEFYLANSKVYRPKENSEFKKGLELFKQVGCASCHTTSFDTKIGKVRPYSDFLLHDMGKDLADGRVEFKASGSEFRTAPLWGLALHKKINKKEPRLLHDGRARNFQEAILWHGGEAKNVKDTYMSLPKEKREQLIKFLGKL
ncbi:di-heme oxidoredictase family protein [Arcobacter sp. CECT 8985]|uniref:di-heme oxidoredictase family protein n=1 Tax=Arcobacter sp. CECT 8985 TaxID=1935424 RepID=UPI00100BD354|nr:di-heme oxidoredictase family protein [Arcobacter sp. CECT 8985]RXJ87243.1 thiol oxidoreductase [Arcobacter sp. CECT 8985]